MTPEEIAREEANKFKKARSNALLFSVSSAFLGLALTLTWLGWGGSFDELGWWQASLLFILVGGSYAGLAYRHGLDRGAGMIMHGTRRLMADKERRLAGER